MADWCLLTFPAPAALFSRVPCRLLAMFLLPPTAPGDVLVFAKMEDGTYGVCGRKGTKDDVSRKPAVRTVKHCETFLGQKIGVPSGGCAFCKD